MNKKINNVTKILFIIIVFFVKLKLTNLKEFLNKLFAESLWMAFNAGIKKILIAKIVINETLTKIPKLNTAYKFSPILVGKNELII